MDDNQYQDWIKKNLDLEKAYGNCKEYCDAVKAQFPELILVRGHFRDLLWGEREHWWLKTESGEIIDPTVNQFPAYTTMAMDVGPDFYEEWDENQEEPTGLCPNCGEYCFEGRYLCSNRCEVSYRAYIMGGCL